MDTNLFDGLKEYDEMLNKGIKLSGENKRFLMVGRVHCLQRQLPSDFNPQQILDFGCGTGETTYFLSGAFPKAKVIGYDLAENTLAQLNRLATSLRVSFCSDFNPELSQRLLAVKIKE